MKAKSGGKSKAPRKTTSPRAAAREDSVDQYLESLVHPFHAEIVALRRVILESDRRITDGIKWNAPSFCCGEWFATFNLRSKNVVQIVFHRGARSKTIGRGRYVEDSSAILQWVTNDRAVASHEDVKAKTPALRKLVAQWVTNLTAEG